MPKTSQRTASFAESVIRGMTRLANECGAINLSQGFPDFHPPEQVLEALERIAREGPHQYAVTWGAPKFRAALARKQSRFTQLPIDPDENIVVTCGSTEAMMVAMMTACNPGDKVIVFSPFYENYAADAILCGAVPIHVELRPPDFTFDPDELRRAFRQGAKALVLCNPSNPSGKVFTREELLVVANLAHEFDAFVLTDEVYEHIVYEPYYHTYFSHVRAHAILQFAFKDLLHDRVAPGIRNRFTYRDQRSAKGARLFDRGGGGSPAGGGCYGVRTSRQLLPRAATYLPRKADPVSTVP
jgi:aminotransferase